MLSANQIACFLNELFLQSKLSKSGYGTLKLTVSQEWFFVCWYKFMQIKRWLKALEAGMAWSKIGVAILVMGL